MYYFKSKETLEIETQDAMLNPRYVDGKTESVDSTDSALIINKWEDNVKVLSRGSVEDCVKRRNAPFLVILKSDLEEYTRDKNFIPSDNTDGESQGKKRKRYKTTLYKDVSGEKPIKIPM